MKVRLVSTCAVLLALLMVLFSCEDDSTIVEEDNPIAEIKTANWEDNIGEEFTLEAFLVLTPEPTLHFDLEDRLKNTYIPEERYFRLDVDPLLMREMPDSYHGARVKITGILAKDDDQSSASLAELLVRQTPN